MGRATKINPYGRTGVYICYTNIYHACLVKLLHDCSESMGSCENCPVEQECNKCFESVSDFRAKYARYVGHTLGVGITSETFPAMVLQFSKFRDKAREYAYQTTKENYKKYISRKEVQSVNAT